MNKKVLEAATNWWIDQITGLKLNWDNGAQNEGSSKDREVGNKMWMLGNMVANQAREGITKEQIDIFRDKLMENIENKFKMNPSENFHCILSVDYYPGEILSESVLKAGIDPNVFPCKTIMWISEEKVIASCGYGSSEKQIFPIE